MGSPRAFNSAYAVPRSGFSSYDRCLGVVAMGWRRRRFDPHVYGQYAARRSSQRDKLRGRFAVAMAPHCGGGVMAA